MSLSTSFTTSSVGSPFGRKSPILKSPSPLVSTHYDYFNHLAYGSQKSYTFGWVYLRSFNLIFPSFVKIYFSSIFAYDTLICLVEITPNVAQNQILTPFVFVLY